MLRQLSSFLVVATAAVSLSGCVENGGPGYVESRVINEGRIGGPYYEGRVVGAGVVVGDRGYYREPAYRERPRIYRDRYAGRGYRDGYRDGYRRWDRPGRDYRNFCADVGYDDPRCE